MLIALPAGSTQRRRLTIMMIVCGSETMKRSGRSSHHQSPYPPPVHISLLSDLTLPPLLVILIIITCYASLPHQAQYSHSTYYPVNKNRDESPHMCDEILIQEMSPQVQRTSSRRTSLGQNCRPRDAIRSVLSSQLGMSIGAVPLRASPSLPAHGWTATCHP